MATDDNRKVEDALQAIKSLVEASGIETSEDDGTIRLDSIVWRGSVGPETQDAEPNLIALNPLERPLDSGGLEQQFDTPYSMVDEDISSIEPKPDAADASEVSNAQTDETSGHAYSAGKSAEMGWPAFHPSDRLSAYDTVSETNFFEPTVEVQNQPEVDSVQSSVGPSQQLNQQAALEIEETRALLAEFQNLLDSTIALKNASVKTDATTPKQGQADATDRRANLSELAKIALDARMSLTNGLEQEAQHAVNTAEPSHDVQESAQALDEIILSHSHTSDDANHVDGAQSTLGGVIDAAVGNVADVNDDSKAIVSEAVAEDSNVVTAGRGADSIDISAERADIEKASDTQKLSNIALHLVDVAERTEPEYKSLFTSAVRSTMQDIIRRQMTDWLAANMTDIIEDALRDELQPAKSKHPNSTNRRDQNT